jgi:hypothetical protein
MLISLRQSKKAKYKHMTLHRRLGSAFYADVDPSLQKPNPKTIMVYGTLCPS